MNVDVADVEKATRFYCDALGLRVGRRFEGAVELLGLNAPLYLLEKPAGTQPFTGSAKRHYERHWTPVHLDFEVKDLRAAVARAMKAGATMEQDIETHPWGRIARFADPFGNGFCLLELVGRGYDEIALKDQPTGA